MVIASEEGEFEKEWPNHGFNHVNIRVTLESLESKCFVCGYPFWIPVMEAIDLKSRPRILPSPLADRGRGIARYEDSCSRWTIATAAVLTT